MTSSSCLRQINKPSVLLEGGSIINRDEELVLATPEHRARISAAAVEAVEKFCALRLPQDAGLAGPPPAQRGDAARAAMIRFGRASRWF